MMINAVELCSMLADKDPEAGLILSYNGDENWTAKITVGQFMRMIKGRSKKERIILVINGESLVITDLYGGEDGSDLHLVLGSKSDTI